MANPLIGKHAPVDDPIAARAKRKQAAQASTWRYNPQLEQLARMRDTRPADFDRMRPDVKVSLAYYERAKAAAVAEGIDTDPPPAA